jgi:hypothetical protein
MKLVFIHGWSVTSTATYGELPQALVDLAPESLSLDIEHIHLGRYISFSDAVTLDDIAIAFEAARLRELGDEAFSVITHSTGGPLIRNWLARYYGDDLAAAPLKHMIMLAPANHGSALAQLGKSRISRLKAWFDGIEPGQKILDWLELGSEGQYQLNRQWLAWDLPSSGIFPFVFTGETIDSALYDYMNSYTGEAGSDGVVRVCATNMNFTYGKLVQDKALSCQSFDKQCTSQFKLEAIRFPQEKCAFEIIPKASHSNKKMGIINSITLGNAANKLLVQRIFSCLAVTRLAEYQQVSLLMSQTMAGRQRKSRYSMLVVRVRDDLGYRVEDLLCGDDYHAGKLPKGLVIDKQRNSVTANVISLYLDATKLQKLKAGKLGIKLIARPDKGFSYYKSAEYHCTPEQVSQLLKPDETTILDLVIERFISADTFSFAQVGDAPSFKNSAGDII